MPPMYMDDQERTFSTNICLNFWHQIQATSVQRVKSNIIELNLDQIVGGHAAHSNALRLARKSNRIVSSYFMAYHTPLRTSQDFIRAMQSAQFLARNITVTINSQLQELGFSPVEISAHSDYYVFYEQYNSIVKAAVFQLICSQVSM